MRRNVYDSSGRLTEVPNKISFLYAKDIPKEPLHYLPTYAYVGGFQDSKMHGFGTLYKKVSFGLVIYFIGTFEDNEPKEGKMFYPDQKIKFHGLLCHEKISRGTLYKEDGTIQWTGSFKDEVPHGEGTGTYLSFSFHGIMDNGKPSFGTLTKQGGFIHYSGHFEAGLAHGPGRTPTEVGDFDKGILVYGSTSKKAFVDGIPVYRYVGAFENNTWHGRGTLFFKMFDIDEDTLYKFVGTFVNGRRHGSFDIYKTDETDPLLHLPGTKLGPCLASKTFATSISCTFGNLLATVDFNHNVHTGDMTLLDPNGLLYSGSGRLFFEGQILAKHGPGTVFVKNRPRYLGMFEMNTLVYVQKLYDEEGLLLFEQNDVPMYKPIDFLDDACTWPKLSGRGKVYAKDGYLYTGSFLDGYLLHAEALVRELVPKEIVLQMPVDYITYESLGPGTEAILINDLDGFQKPIAVETFLTLCQNVLKDPVRGAYPGIRFQKVLLK